MRHRHYIIVFLTFILYGIVVAHDWQEINSTDLSQDELERLISFVEARQAELDPTVELTPIQLAKDWLAWFELELRLDTREGQTKLSELLADLYADEEFRVLRWRHEMEHISLVYDASFSSIDQAAVLAQLESLDVNDESLFKRREDLSYTLEFVTVSQADKEALEPFLERLGVLVVSAQEGR